MKRFFHQLTSAQFFYRYSEHVLPWLGILTLILFGVGLIGALIIAPADYQQGDGFRLIYIHVPSAFMSLAVYSFMGCCAFVYLIWKIKLADLLLRAATALGAWFTFLALISGAFWGKPMWGTWWIWDARLTSELILLFLYLGLIALQHAFAQKQQAARVIAVFTLIGLIDLPIIHYSVYWWSTLHQGATIARFDKPAIAFSMLWPLLIMLAAFMSYFVLVLLMRGRAMILEQEKVRQWINQLQK